MTRSLLTQKLPKNPVKSLQSRHDIMFVLFDWTVGNFNPPFGCAAVRLFELGLGTQAERGANLLVSKA